VINKALFGAALCAHTNCHDIQAEAQREYGLTPDDVHDSFNLFMYTEICRDGRAAITRQDTKPGDHVDLMALVDVLAVPNVRGADLMRTSNFALKPIELTLFEATEADMAARPKTPILKSQRTPKDFRNATIKADRQLTHDSSYVAEFDNTPIRLKDVAVELSTEEAAMLDGLRLPVYGADDGAAQQTLLERRRNEL
jgi:hypothetical protein